MFNRIVSSTDVLALVRIKIDSEVHAFQEEKFLLQYVCKFGDLGKRWKYCIPIKLRFVLVRILVLIMVIQINRCMIVYCGFKA